MYVRIFLYADRLIVVCVRMILICIDMGTTVYTYSDKNLRQYVTNIVSIDENENRSQLYAPRI